jgi:hypothetical protein
MSLILCCQGAGDCVRGDARERGPGLRGGTGNCLMLCASFKLRRRKRTWRPRRARTGFGFCLKNTKREYLMALYVPGARVSLSRALFFLVQVSRFPARLVTLPVDPWWLIGTVNLDSINCTPDDMQRR